MAWSVPNTASAGDVLSATNWNTYIRDNLNYLLAPPHTDIKRNNSGDYSTTSSSFVDIDGTNLSITLTLNSGRVLIGFFGSFYSDVDGRLMKLDIAVDGTRIGNDLVQCALLSTSKLHGFVTGHTGLSVGSHTFKVQWNVGLGTAYLQALSGTKALFWVLEV